MLLMTTSVVISPDDKEERHAKTGVAPGGRDSDRQSPGRKPVGLPGSGEAGAGRGRAVLDRGVAAERAQLPRARCRRPVGSAWVASPGPTVHDPGAGAVGSLGPRRPGRRSVGAMAIAGDGPRSAGVLTARTRGPDPHCRRGAKPPRAGASRDTEGV